MPTGSVNGIALRYKIGGPPDKEILVMLHGWTASHQLFEFCGFFEALSKQLHVVSFDQRGHGDSEKPEEGYGLEQFTGDVKGLLDHLGIRRKVIVLGQSMGGYIAAGFALRYPEAAKGLILMNTTLHLLDGKDSREAWQAVIEAQKVDREGTMRNVIGQMFRKQPKPELVDRQIEMTMKTPLPIAIRVFKEVFAGGVLKDGHKITIPTLIIHGEHDIIPLHHAEAAHRAIPGSKLVVMKDCGHLPSLEMPEETQRLILEFVASL